jgi:hypothetical protein
MSSAWEVDVSKLGMEGVGKAGGAPELGFAKDTQIVRIKRHEHV